MKRVAVVEVSAVEVIAINNRSTVRNVSVVVVDYPVAMPVPSPVIPAPPKSPEETDSKSSAEEESGAAIKDSRHGIPTWIGNDGISVHEPRIVRRDVHHIRIDRLNDNRVALSR